MSLAKPQRYLVLTVPWWKIAPGQEDIDFFKKSLPHTNILQKHAGIEHYYCYNCLFWYLAFNLSTQKTDCRIWLVSDAANEISHKAGLEIVKLQKNTV